MKKATSAAVSAQALMESLRDAPRREAGITEITVVPEFNPRRLLSDDALAPEALTDLAENIRQYGVLQPLLVREREGQLVLIAGERRLLAAKLAGVQSVPIVTLEVDDGTAYEIAIIENAQRKDLDLVTETLVGFDFLSRRLKMPVEEVVTYLGNVRKGRTDDVHGAETLLRTTYGTGVSVWSLQRSRILRMTPEERSAVRSKLLDAKVAGELTALPTGHPQRPVLLERAIQERMSADAVRELVRVLLDARPRRGGELGVRVASLKRVLPTATRLKGEDAVRAAALMHELEALLSK